MANAVRTELKFNLWWEDMPLGGNHEKKESRLKKYFKKKNSLEDAQKPHSEFKFKIGKAYTFREKDRPAARKGR